MNTLVVTDFKPAFTGVPLPTNSEWFALEIGFVWEEVRAAFTSDPDVVLIHGILGPYYVCFSQHGIFTSPASSAPDLD